MTPKTAAIIFAHAIVGWALCGATIGLGLAFTTLSTVLVVHLVAAPVFFIGITWVYFRWFGFITPLENPSTTVLVSHAPRFRSPGLQHRWFPPPALPDLRPAPLRLSGSG